MVPPGVAEVAARAQRELAGRVLAITLRSVRDLDIAEEATADAFRPAPGH
jgi:predicted RNA polymerase sigma factor